MCDMRKMPASEDASCEEDSEMNFAAFSAVGSPGTHYVTAGGQLPVAKLQQNVAANGSTLQQVVGMVGDVNVGVQYVRSLDGGATLQTTPQLISVPIALPGAKPGDPQPTVQIQVLNPGLLQQQQPKYQMQIPIQGFQQGGAVLTLAYSPDANDAGGIQLLGNALPDGTFRMRSGLQVVTMPQEMQLVQPQQTHNQSHDKEQQIHHQVFITPNQQIIINSLDENKVINNNTSSDNNNESMEEVIVKEECDDNTHDDESSQGTEASDSMSWQVTGSGSQMDLIKYLNTLQPQQTQALPVSLQQFLRLNPATDCKKVAVEIEVMPNDDKASMSDNAMDEEGAMRIQNNAGAKKKKKYKKKPSKPARPKPGQVVIATAADGTNIFCCPECQMAYPEKEQLEMHLIVHKIERRFICGICGAGLKRKEHLERHKLGHNPERPFVCGVCRKGFKRREHLNLHAVIHSGVKTEMCKECGKGFYRKDHLRKHTRSHEHKRARDEAALAADDIKPNIVCNNDNNNILPEITIHVPTGGNVNVPVQINIPQHVVSSLAAAQAHAQEQQQQQQHQNNSDAQSQLDALLAQHT